MQIEIVQTVNEIDAIIRSNPFFDLYVYSYDTDKLIIAGSQDLTYYHTLEIIFEDVLFVSGKFTKLSTDKKSPIISMPENSKFLNIKYEIEQGYNLFRISVEDLKNNFFVAAKSISFNNDTVYYYNKKNLNRSERLAYFVKNVWQRQQVTLAKTPLLHFGRRQQFSTNPQNRFYFCVKM